MASCLGRRAADFSGKRGSVCSGSSGGANQNGRALIGCHSPAGCVSYNPAFSAGENRLSGRSARAAAVDSAKQMTRSLDFFERVQSCHIERN